MQTHGRNIGSSDSSLTTIDSNPHSINFANGSHINFEKGQCIEIGDHTIEYNDDFTEFECAACGESFDVPEIFQASTGFRQTVYQLYIVGHFRNNECPGLMGGERLDELLDQTDNCDDSVTWPAITPPVNPGDVYWVDGLNNPVHYYDSDSQHNYWATDDGTIHTTESLIKSLPPKSAESFVAETGFPGAAQTLQEYRKI